MRFYTNNIERLTILAGGNSRHRDDGTRMKLDVSGDVRSNQSATGGLYYLGSDSASYLYRNGGTLNVTAKTGETINLDNGTGNTIMTQNGVVPFTSVGTGAVANTRYIHKTRQRRHRHHHSRLSLDREWRNLLRDWRREVSRRQHPNNVAYLGSSQTVTAGNVSSGAFGFPSASNAYAFPAALAIGTSTTHWSPRQRSFVVGNVGIGTTAPDAGTKLQVAGGILTSGAFQVLLEVPVELIIVVVYDSFQWVQVVQQRHVHFYC